MADPHAHDTAPGTAPGTDIDTGEYAALFPTLTFDRPADGVLRITLDGPGLNAVSPQGHAHLADVWLRIDRDPSVRAAVIQGAGKAFSAGGSFQLLDELTTDYAALEKLAKENYGLSDVQQLNSFRNYVMANLTAMRLYGILSSQGKKAFANEVARVVKL